MFNLFRSKPLLDGDTTQWLFESYGWALRNFGSDLFRQETLLVTPTEAHFPTPVDSRESMASSLFQQLVHYAGMQRWPLALIELTATCEEPPYPSKITFNGIPRGAAASITLEGEARAFPVTYSSALTRDPAILTAVIARQLASHLIHAAQTPGPGGKALHGHLIDLLAVFMGFGLFLANSAVIIQRGCSGCGKSVQATGFLSEDQTTYALAIFCCLKQIPDKEARPYLKSALRPLFKKALKEVADSGRTGPLNQITHPIPSTSNAV